MTNKLAFIFPGQASQHVGMGKEIADNYPEAAQIFAQADKILGFPLSTMCWAGPEADLNETYNTQSALFVTSMACLAALQAGGYTAEPDFVAGHSVGEFSAYVAAGVLSFEEGLKLVRERGRLMKKAGERNPGKMAAILTLDDEQVADICAQVSTETAWVQVANYNNPGQVVISGEEAGIDRAIELAKAAGARRAQKLPISIAAHSKLMAVINDEFKAAVNTVTLSKPKVSIVANITAQPLTSVEAIRDEMVGQLTASVQWTQSIRYMIEQGITQFIEVGSKNVLCGMIRRIDRSVSAISVENLAGINKVVEAQA